MTTNLRVSWFAVLFSFGACSVVQQVDEVPYKIVRACIERNSASPVDLSRLLAEGFRRNGVATTVVDAPATRDHEFVIRYEASTKWDFVSFLADAKVDVFRRSQRVGGLRYLLPDSSGGLSWSKFDSDEEKLDPMIDRMLTRSRSGAFTADPAPEAVPFSTGSGFFVSEDGYFVTAAHVVGQSGVVSIASPSGDLRAALVAKDDRNDIALLKVDGRFSFLRIRDSSAVRLGEVVATVGFPNPSIQGLQPKFSKGEIAGLSGLGDDPTSFQVSVPIQPGNSGGPLFDGAGRVVGIVVAKLRAETVLEDTGSLPENVNYAVKSSLLLDLLRTANVRVDELAIGAESGESQEESIPRAVAACALVKVF